MNSNRTIVLTIVITVVITIVIAVAATMVRFGAAWWLLPGGGEGTAGGSSGEREIRYWVAPMDPNFRRDAPGKSPMGMDLVPVYADGEEAKSDTPSIRIDPVVINSIGVQTDTAVRDDLPRRIETVARVEPNEHRLGHVHVRTEGWIEILNVHAEGGRVERGDVLFRFYAPALVSAQSEYLQALDQERPAIIKASAERLMALGLQPQQIERLEESRDVQRLVDVKAPHDGYVMNLNVRHGMFVTPSLMIMSIADLSTVWVEADVFENHAARVAPGQLVHMTVPGAARQVWLGEVDYVYPTIRPESRTARARIVFDNPELELKPGMYAKVRIDAAPRDGVVVVPSQAVIRTGRQERVVLALGDGRFRPAVVVTGLESGGRTEIIEGLSAGERIVVSGQFLIDSEASMDASLMRMIGEDAPTQALPREQGRDKGGMDHSGHDMGQGAPTQALPRRQERDQGEMDHSGHDMNQDAPTQALPRKQGRDQDVEAEIEFAAHFSFLPRQRGEIGPHDFNSLPRKQEEYRPYDFNSLPRSRGRAGVGANPDEEKS